MERLERVLVPVSLSAADDSLLRYARMLADLGVGRHYHFVHAHVPGTTGAAQGSETELQNLLETRVAEVMSGNDRYAVTCRIASGSRIDALLDVATRQRSDLILLGHRRARSGQRSLARRLAMVAPCSVWLVPEGAPVALDRILAPIDFSDHSADSLRVAAGIARAAKLEEVMALHVFFGELPPRYDETRDELRSQEFGAFEQFLARTQISGVKVTQNCVESPDPAKTILRVAHDHDMNLLVMNTRGRSRAAAILLGSITAQVMTETPIAILAVKHFGAMMGLFQTLREGHFWQRTNSKIN